MFCIEGKGGYRYVPFCKIFFQYGKSHTGGAQVFLYACPNHVEMVEIYASGKDIRGHVTMMGIFTSGNFQYSVP